MNITQLQHLEQDKALIDKYIKSAAFGKNRLLFLPFTIGVFLALFLAYAAYDGMLSLIGTTTSIIVAVVCIACFILTKYINNASLKKLKATTGYTPFCIAKKIYGNDNSQIYYCIYTVGNKRHDAVFINRIAEKIFAVPDNTNDPIEKKINKLFQIELAKPNEFGSTLPPEFTENEIVWRRQFSHFSLSKPIKQDIEDADGNFVVAAINPENAKFAHEYYH